LRAPGIRITISGRIYFSRFTPILPSQPEHQAFIGRHVALVGQAKDILNRVGYSGIARRRTLAIAFQSRIGLLQALFAH